MARIYLAKSNRASFDDVALLRKHLTERGHEIVEFLGGEYSSEPLELSDACIMVVEPQTEQKVIVGRGLYEQANICIYKTNKPVYLFNTQSSEKIIVNPIKTTEMLDETNWRSYGYLVLNPETEFQ